jgi:hypothetical protein
MSLKDSLMTFWCSPEEKDILIETAKRLGIARSEIIRMGFKHIAAVYSEMKKDLENEVKEEAIKALSEGRRPQIKQIMKKFDENADKEIRKRIFDNLRDSQNDDLFHK